MHNAVRARTVEVKPLPLEWLILVARGKTPFLTDPNPIRVTIPKDVRDDRANGPPGDRGYEKMKQLALGNKSPMSHLWIIMRVNVTSTRGKIQWDYSTTDYLQWSTVVYRETT